MKKIYISLMLGFCTVTFTVAQKTFAKDIANIIYQKCSTCHRSGEIGPMPLTNFDQVANWGETIKQVTADKIMPPWQPDPSYSTFLGENYLTDEEIDAIASWVDGGMPRGDVSEEPEFPSFPDGSALGTPDLVLEMSEDWVHEGNNKDDYRYFVFPTDLPENKIIKAVEFRPGNSKIVHHALLFEDRTGQAKANDDATPEYGFNGFGSFTDSDDLTAILEQKQYPGFVPGQKPIRFPDGLGQVLHTGADVVAQIHYAPWPVDEPDRSTINIFFMDETEETYEREVESHIMVPLFNVISALFIIPANSQPTFHGRYVVPKDVSIVNIAPHMHLLGTSWEVWLEKPDAEIVNLIKVPEWDFNWQGTYNFDRYIVAPAGSTIHARAAYDNTATNPNNPSNPPKFVTWGEGTEDEMYYLPIGFVDYQAGDENIVFTENSTVGTKDLFNHKNIIYPLEPNPVADFAVAGFYLEKGQSIDMTIFDINGRKIRTLRSSEFFNTGRHSINFSTKNLTSGIYILQMSGSGFLTSQKFIKH